MNEESLLSVIEEKSIPTIRENENIVTFSPGGGQDNIHQIPDWAYRRLLSDAPLVDKSKKDSDFLRVRIGYRDGQSASTLISRIHELQRRIYIDEISFTPRTRIDDAGFAVIADISYAKDNINSLLYLLEDLEAEILQPIQSEYIKILL